jgi:methenyltetrahydromethanopterin cyclohydrolase
VERELFERLGYAEDAERAVLVLEGRALPGDEVAAWVAERAGLDPAGLTIAVAPTASLAGGVQVVARSVETALHKMEQLGFDVTRVASGWGIAPLPPVARNDLRAIGRTNDCILYAGEVHLHVRAGDDELAALAAKLPASSSPDYGTPFHETFRRYDGDFYRIDPHLFSPAVVHLTSLTTGRTHHGGEVNVEVWHRSMED